MARKIVNIVATVILIVLLILVVLIFITRISGETPAIFGYQIYRVSSGSMEPKLSVGDVILVKSTPIDEIHKGDIITYKGEQGDFSGLTVTHMVTEEPILQNGVWKLQTQGLLENSNPDPPITGDQVKGKYLTSLTALNGVYTFFLSPTGLIVFIAVIVVVFAFEMISLIVSYKKIDKMDDDYYAPKAKKESKKRKKPKKTHLNK